MKLAHQVAAEVARNNSQRRRAKQRGGSPPACLADLLAQSTRNVHRPAAPTGAKPKRE